MRKKSANEGKLESKGISRRALLEGAGYGLMAIAGAPVASSSALAQQPAQSAEQPKSGGVLRIAASEEPFAPAFDMHRISSLGTNRMGYQAYSGLVNVTTQRDLEPDLAESWEQPDATTYVFRLRKGVTFHDGTPLDAAAVKFNIERIADPKTGSPKRADFSLIEQIDLLDPLTIRLKLARPFIPMLSTFRRSYFQIMSPTAVQAHIAQDPFKASVGTGPFRFVSYSKGDKIVLERFKEYWKGPTQLDRMEFHIIPEQSTQLAGIESGSIDVLTSATHFVDQIRQSRKVRLEANPTTAWDFLAFNVSRAPFTDRRVRQAFSMAVDREGIGKAVFRGEAKAAQGPISPAFPAFFRDNSDIPYQKYDPDRAKSLLKDADYPFGTELRFDSMSERPRSEIADVIAAALTAIGVKVRLVKADFPTFSKYFYGTKDYWLGNSSWTGGGQDPDALIYKQFVTGQSLNVGNYANPQLDDLLNSARAELDHERRADLYNKANRLLMEECYNAFLVYPNDVSAMRNEVKGFHFRDELAGPWDECWLAR